MRKPGDANAYPGFVMHYIKIHN